MKKIKCIMLLLPYVFFAQKIEYGKYVSEKGSYLILNKDKTFLYQKSESVILDVASTEIFMESYGNFKQKDNLLFLTTPAKSSNYTDSITDKGIKINTISSKEKSKDSINIILKNKNDLCKVYICNSGLEYKLTVPFNSAENCVLLKSGINKVPKFYEQKISFQIYPNYDSPYVRGGYYHTPYFTYLLKRSDLNSNILIDVDFHELGFTFESFDQEIVLIKNNNTLFFKGEDFVLKN